MSAIYEPINLTNSINEDPEYNDIYHDNDKIDFARTVNASDFEFAISKIYTNQNINRDKESLKLFI